MAEFCTVCSLVDKWTTDGFIGINQRLFILVRSTARYCFKNFTSAFCSSSHIFHLLIKAEKIIKHNPRILGSCTVGFRVSSILFRPPVKSMAVDLGADSLRFISSKKDLSFGRKPVNFSEWTWISLPGARIVMLSEEIFFSSDGGVGSLES